MKTITEVKEIQAQKEMLIELRGDAHKRLDILNDWRNLSFETLNEVYICGVADSIRKSYDGDMQYYNETMKNEEGRIAKITAKIKALPRVTREEHEMTKAA